MAADRWPVPCPGCGAEEGHRAGCAEAALTQIMAVLTGEERDYIERRAAALAGWEGAHADDILAAAYDADAHLDVREPFMAANPDLAGPAGAYALLAVAWLGRRVTRDEVTGLLHRAGLLPAVGQRDVEALAAEFRGMSDRTAGLAGIAADLDRPDLAYALTALAGDISAVAASLGGIAEAEAARAR